MIKCNLVVKISLCGGSHFVAPFYVAHLQNKLVFGYIQSSLTLLRCFSAEFISKTVSYVLSDHG